MFLIVLENGAWVQYIKMNAMGFKILGLLDQNLDLPKALEIPINRVSKFYAKTKFHIYMHFGIMRPPVPKA